MASSVRYKIRDADGEMQTFLISLEALLEIGRGNREATLGELLRGTLSPGQKLLGGGELIGNDKSLVTDFSNAQTIGSAIDYRFEGVETPPSPIDAIELSGESGRRAAFGNFLSRGGVEAGNSFARQAGEQNFSAREAAFRLNSLINPTQFSGPNAFTDYLNTQRVGGSRENLQNIFTQLRGVDRDSLGEGSQLAGALTGREENGRNVLANAANALISSSYSPLLNLDRRTSADLGSDFLQAQGGGFSGDFEQYLNQYLGLDRLGVR